MDLTERISQIKRIGQLELLIEFMNETNKLHAKGLISNEELEMRIRVVKEIREKLEDDEVENDDSIMDRYPEEFV